MSTPDPCIQVTELTALFQRVYQQRMQDMPMVNPALCVEAVGFRPWTDRCIGILITPWFMSLIALLPSDEGVSPPATDEKCHYQFPSGDYDFLVCYDEQFGLYHSCSLFSPMFDFPSQELAQQTALAVLDLLWQAPEGAQPAQAPRVEATGKLSRRQLLRGLRSEDKP